MRACSTRSRLRIKCEMTYVNTLKSFLFLGPFLLLQFVSRGNEFFSAACSPFFGVSCIICGHKLEVKGALKRTAVSCTSFFTLHTCFLSGTNLHDGLWHSVDINARRHRITLTLDNNAATASHATTVSRIYSGNSYYFGGRFFQTDAEQVFMMQVLRFSPLRSPQLCSVCS